MMMNPFSFGFPPIRRPYPNYTPPVFPISSPNFQNHSGNSNYSNCNNNSKHECINNLEKNNKSFKDDEEFFEIFGLKLYFDDLLIIALLFFLYQEDVKDTYLYIALILLLLS